MRRLTDETPDLFFSLQLASRVQDIEQNAAEGLVGILRDVATEYSLHGSAAVIVKEVSDSCSKVPKQSLTLHLVSIHATATKQLDSAFRLACTCSIFPCFSGLITSNCRLPSPAP